MTTTVRIIKTLPVLFFCFFGMLSHAQISVVHVATDDKASRHEGIYYALPKTYIKVDVWVDKVETIRGPYAEYAARLLGLETVPRTNSVAYHLAGVSLSSYHEADPDHFYFVRIPDKNTGGLRFSLTPEGILKSADWQENEKVSKKDASQTHRRESLFRDEFLDITVPGLIEKVDTFIRRISLDTTTFEEIFFRKTFIEKSTEQKAREAADFILKLEDHRLSLVTGYHEVNYSAEVMRFMNDELKQLQDEYLALFKGKTTTSTSQYSFIFDPQAGNEDEPLTLFKFDTRRGVVDKAFPAGEAVQVSFTGSGKTWRTMHHQKEREKGKRKGKGFHYRIPDQAVVKVKMANELLAESRFLVSQLGVLTFLPFENVKEVQFYPETGSVKYFRLD